MRLFPILAAILVSALIYAFVMERDTLFAALSGAPDTPAETTTENARPATQTPAPQAKPVGVVALRSTARNIDRAVVVRGQTQADRQVELRAETSGQIISPPIRRGAFVDAGQTLCSIDPGTRQSSLAEANAALAEARARLPESKTALPTAEARVKESQARLIEARALLREAEINANAAERLATGGFASETRVAQTQAAVEGARAQITSAEAGLQVAEAARESAAAGVEAARAGIESAQAELAVAQRELQRLDITAPFAGLLESDTAELGSLLQAGSLCATVIQLDPIMLVGYIPETEISKVRMDAPATARLASGDRVEGVVTFISRAADPTTRTFRVDVRVPNPDLHLRDGQTAEIQIAAEGSKAHLLPQSALTLDDEGTLGVRVVADGNTAQFTPITLLRDSPNGVFVAGLPDQADVIVVGQEYVTDGVPVAPTFRELGQ